MAPHPARDVALFTILLLGSKSAHAAQAHVVTDLGAGFQVQALNDDGLIVGWKTNELGFQRPLLWENGQLIDLGTLGGTSGQAFDVNSKRQIAGTAQDASFDGRPVVWQGGTIVDLGTLGGTDGRSFGINEKGQVVGWSYDAGNAFQRPFFHDGTSMVDLGSFGPWQGEANALNDEATVVGWSGVGVGDVHAFRAAGGPPLQDLQGLPTFTDAIARDVSSNGDVVGQSRLAGQGERATWWKADGTVVDLGHLGFVNHSIAYAINDAGDIAGNASGRAALWVDGTPTDLNERLEPGSGWVLKEARDVNAFGQVVGTGTLDGASHAFLLSPLPHLVATDTVAPGDMVHVDLFGRVGSAFCVVLGPEPGPITIPGVPFPVDLGPDMRSFTTTMTGDVLTGVVSASFVTPASTAFVGQDFYWQAFTTDGIEARKSNRRQTLFRAASVGP